DQTELNRIESDGEHDRHHYSRRLGRYDARTVSKNDGHLAVNQIGCQCWQLVVTVFGEAVFNCYILAVDIANRFQSLVKRLQKRWLLSTRSAVEVSDHRQPRLCARHKWLCRTRDDSGYEIAPSHGLPRGLGLRRLGCNYSRVLRPAKWG